MVCVTSVEQSRMEFGSVDVFVGKKWSPNTSERIRKGHILESEGLIGFEDVVEVENDGAGDALPNNGRNRRLVLELDLSRTVREEIREKRHSGAHSA